jgi:hypothetical protein
MLAPIQLPLDEMVFPTLNLAYRACPSGREARYDAITWIPRRMAARQHQHRTVSSVQSSSMIPTAARSSIGWTWYDKPHYLVPDDKVGEEAFSIIREAMVKSSARAISRVVLYHRERAVLLEPRDKGMVLWTPRRSGNRRAWRPPRSVNRSPARRLCGAWSWIGQLSAVRRCASRREPRCLPGASGG